MTSIGQESTQPRAPRVRFIARTLVPLALIAGTSAALLYTGLDALRGHARIAVSPVAMLATDAPAAGSPIDAMQAAGWIEPAPYAHEVRALRPGVVAAVRTLEGSVVARDEVLAVLENAAETTVLGSAEASVAVARAAVATAERAVAAAERTRELAIDPIRRLALAEAALAEARAELARLGPQLREAEALHAEALDESQRKSRLVATGSVGEGEARRLALRAQALAAKLEALALERAARDARCDGATAELAAARLARETLVAETGAVDAARAMLAERKAELARSEAERDIAALALARSEIRAPVAGTVLARHAQPGSRADADSMPLFTLYDPSSLQVRCDLPLRDAARLAVDLEAEVRVDALPDRVFTGRVARIVPLGDIQKNTVQCKIELVDPDPALRPEMLARVRILAGGPASVPRGEAVAAPLAALRARSGDSAQILVAVPEGRVSRTELRRIELGRERGGGWIEVRAGLAAGDRVVLDPAVAAGLTVTAVESPVAAPPTPEGAAP